MKTYFDFAVRVVALQMWGWGVWLILTWTVTAQQLVEGALVALACAIALAPLGHVAPPWRLFDPRRVVVLVVLVLASLGRIIRANLDLARRIWTPSRPLRSGMLIVPTTAKGDGDLAATGLLTSLIVDNQVVDLDRTRDSLQYHAIDVPDGDYEERAESVNAPTERLLTRLVRPSR